MDTLTYSQDKWGRIYLLVRAIDNKLYWEIGGTATAGTYPLLTPKDCTYSYFVVRLPDRTILHKTGYAIENCNLIPQGGDDE